MSLRARLALAFALFSAVPLAATFWPVSRALSRSLEAEHGARLDAAARAIESEVARIGDRSALAIVDLAGSNEALALARDHASGALAPAEEAGLARAWGEARGLDVLAATDADGRVLSSGHLPGRAGDIDADLAALFASARPGRAVPRLVVRGGPEGVERVLAFVAWAPVAADGARLRVAGGAALGPEQAQRLAALTASAVSIRAPDGAVLAEAGAPDPAPGGRWLRLTAILGGLGGPTREIPLGPPEAPAARIEIASASDGLARARATVLLAFAAALLAGAGAAAAVGGVLASRITHPLEALRDAAARVAAGDLGARVEVRASGEVGDLVRAFNGMTADLATSRVRLAQAERVAAWREVARRLAHEIKNPLTPIAMSVETLRDAKEASRPDFEEIFDEGTRAIGEEVRRLKRIVDEFSRFARLPSPELAPVAAEDLVSSVLALYPDPPPGVTLVRHVEPALPAVLADRDQIVQVLLNLVRNALEAMPAGGTLRIAAHRNGKGVAFDVSDTGAGIAAGDLPRVFEPYFTTKEGGTGLGLSIAQRIAEEHGGALDVVSAAGSGTAFTLTLPVAPGSAAAT